MRRKITVQYKFSHVVSTHDPPVILLNSVRCVRILTSGNKTSLLCPNGELRETMSTKRNKKNFLSSVIYT